MGSGPLEVTRREVLKAAATAAALAPLTNGERLIAAVAPATGAPRFLTRDQFALLDELTEILIPTDEHSAGARAAGVAAYIDGWLADRFTPEPKQRWTDGLARIDQVARDKKGAAFMALTPEDREAVVTVIAGEEANPQSPEGKFFVELKRLTARGYYSSKIGIHDELEYKGNVLQEEYSGTDVSTKS
jgi:Gluconate 2-dehydrogenase subunit 3